MIFLIFMINFNFLLPGEVRWGQIDIEGNVEGVQILQMSNNLSFCFQCMVRLDMK